MSDNEYRVSWKRDGLRWKHQRFGTLAAAERHAQLLRDGDPHYRCDEGHGYYTGSGYHADGGVENEWISTCMPDIVEGPSITQRRVGPWKALA